MRSNSIFREQATYSICRIAAWDAVSLHDAVTNFRTALKEKGAWGVGLSYRLRNGQIKSESKVFKQLEKNRARGLRLWTSCGGNGRPPMDSSYAHNPIGSDVPFAITALTKQNGSYW